MRGRGTGRGFLVGVVIVLVGVVGILAGMLFAGGGTGGEPGEVTVLQFDASAIIGIAALAVIVIAALWVWSQIAG
jgi:hypothetical protein